MRSTYTIRRSIRAGGTERVAIDNGTFNDNFLVKRWYMFPTNGQTAVWAVLNTSGVHPLATAAGFSVDNSQEFGWATWHEDREGILDPQHIIVQDFYIHNLSATHEIQVLIEIERVHTSDAEAALYMIKERSQADLE